MNRSTKKTPDFIRLTLVHLWKITFDGYCKAVGNKTLIDKATRKLQMARIAIFGLSFIVWTYFFSIVGLTPVWVWQNVKEGSLASAVVISFYGLAVYVSYTVLLNIVTAKWHASPDYAPLLKSDTTLDVRQAPDPTPDGNFPIGVDEKNEYAYWNLKGEYYRGNVIFTGQSDLFGKENFINTFIRGVLGAETDAVFLVYDWQHGLDFSYLRKDRRKLLGRKDIDCLYNDEWMTVLGDLPRLPNVAVFDQNEIPRSLEWLEEEFERRQSEFGLVPNAYFPTRIIVVLDWDLTSKLLESANGLNVSILKRIFKADSRLKMNVLAIADPGLPWSKFGGLTSFASGIQFFTSEQAGEAKPAKEGEKGEKPIFVQRTFDIPPLLYKAKVWQRGASRIISFLSCDSDYLAEYIYKQAGNNKFETFELWKAACYFRPFQESDVKKEIVITNQHEN